MKTIYHGHRGPILTARAADIAQRRFLDARVTGRRLAWSREAAGIGQAELAAYIGVSSSTIRRVESGERVLRPPERVAAARALGTSIATFTAPAIRLPAAANGSGKVVAS